MPFRSKHQCNVPNCKALTNERFCEMHAKQAEKAYEAKREVNQPWRKWYFIPWYRKAVDMFKAEHPLCAECAREGHDHTGGHLDHIVPHKGDWELFSNQANWQNLCGHHHNVKTAQEGRWGV